MPGLTIDRASRCIWDYHHLNQTLAPADMIWALGSHDLRVADRVAELWQAGLAPIIVMSGGLGNFTDGVFEKPEAILFAERAQALGVPEDVMFLESASTNCGENVLFTRQLLAEREQEVHSAIAVQKPYMERRTWATIRKQWPELDLVVTSPQLSWDEYPLESISRSFVTHTMLGDLQRIMTYPEQGYMIPQDVPESVMSAFDYLVAAGFTDHLLVRDR